MKQKIKLLLKSFLITMAITANLGMPLRTELYETKIDYVIASVYELLGNYDVKFIFVWILAGVFLFFMEGKAILKGTEKKNTSVGLALFFALCLVFGKSYYETANSVYVFGSVVNFVKSFGVIVGFTCLFYELIAGAYVLLANIRFCGENQGFFAKKPFLKSFVINFFIRLYLE